MDAKAKLVPYKSYIYHAIKKMKEWEFHHTMQEHICMTGKRIAQQINYRESNDRQAYLKMNPKKEKKINKVNRLTG